ncbi:sterol desaturase family protein [Leptospira gomenensis]|uniref:Sterol desaturase family protein n=1 Tax=Leptospira gomenensis TaxID=2484974 RepID=A0A5F1YE04_9LEPT|nr:sterol desaturase family protein [Leptospira gomenensis]TGK34351.1 sterol desaturase family protein [Leptospira gomenensis]TGK37288.1 sterol desaturase family protein [Leptospira gomenensis]TGK50975.1 sterol desaturase family protein [Leptospira gomenensis]TGK56597.1 sterol desaturase family protein [Leptospira gomenensis]
MNQYSRWIENLLELIPHTPAIFMIDFLRYFVFAGLAFLILYVWKHPFQNRKIQNKKAQPSQFLREFLYSVSSVSVYTLVTLTVLFFRKLGYFKFYEDVREYGWGYLFLSVFLILAVQDFYFYWTHRLMHTKPFFRLLHKVHHESVIPSPWTAYSFSPGEALLHALILPIVVSLFPVHNLALLISMTFQIVRNVLGHSGYEIFPGRFLSNGILKHINTNTNHDMHHQFFRYNFGLYTTIWDGLFGTIHPEYEKTFRKITEEKEKRLSDQIENDTN